MASPSTLADSNNKSIDDIVKRIVNETELTEKYPDDKIMYVEYLARAAVHAFDNHGEIEDHAFFKMVRSAVACKPNDLRKWKDHIIDVRGVRRNVVIQNKTLLIKQDHGVFMPILPLSVSAALERRPKDQDYNEKRPQGTENMERILHRFDLPDPQRKIRPKGDPARVRVRR